MTNIAQLVANQRTFFLNGNTMDYTVRKQQLQKLKSMLKENEASIYQALKTDLNKSKHETLTTELGFLFMEIDHTLKQLQNWMEPIKVSAPITHKGTKNYIIKEPLGVCLVISPWNYPLQLALAPAIGALAAGNCVVIKPSEEAKATSALLKKLTETYFDPSYLTVVEGEKETAQELLQQRFDYIFFTGSTAVGRIIMREASKHLTPVTLELGGKSPVIVDKDANINLAAKRIVWGKFTNAGQTCVAPDYLYVHEKVKFKLLKAMKKYIRSFYGRNPLSNKDYIRIINEKHFNRLSNYLVNGSIVHGGLTDPLTLKIEPTILDKITWEDPVMQEEIFGPILPVLTFDEIEEAVSVIRKQEKPLALYYFGENGNTQQQVMQYLSFGGGSINDTVFHLANPHLPFGGVGESGMGAYHGKYSFNTFSHKKSIMKQSTKFDVPFRYPGSKLSETILKKIMK
ncbi:aldehyde dehydrogenase [Virgibacillus pantothenticus]|uniref:Aldehyde dehydrogenase n=1 Tax=Virgibacillus pantothenticus TaxID=1473 RepID=A0A0L0QPC7_VIRPA|nr:MULTISPECIES: aldehyde dehydrogenase [Virgibacillus]API90476.1 aldehyde dehydrogenase family protein [Virgibacillus sp. 6R]KNE20437.1 aldehyde dehydrogenase [Virgibacillus pantothenticus]MEB5451567.1 aldehyde dehydrogenase [Virgibacillus pantothenticus]MEB5455593.1 aldehyde dehydrogenase [Virgibacillus pantothenticus]MEB5459366.1 aldehyde dehydrogenase [Virgibacillus pantothenticus]